MADIMNQMAMIDTDILIDAGLGVPEATTCLQQLEHNACLAVSVITQMELMVGGGNKKE